MSSNASTTKSTVMRLLVACGTCKTQLDASGLPAGSRFHCACAAVIEVPTISPRDAAVVRCSSCGAARQAESPACGFCDSDFTLFERDLHTLCPSCMTRISDRASFCHACGIVIAPDGPAGEISDRSCPACGPERQLIRRPVGDVGLTMLECPLCTGMWLGREAFQLLEERARSGALPWRSARPPEPSAAPHMAAEANTFYRPCLVCNRLMHRQNYGRKSAVLIDTCAEHGIWFDREELQRILLWLRQGGFERARELQREEEAQAARSKRMAPLEGTILPEISRGRSTWSLLDLGLELVDFLGSLRED